MAQARLIRPIFRHNKQEMGLCASSVDEDYSEICVQLTRLKLEIDSKIEKLRAEALKQEGNLVAEFKKQKSLRAYSAEHAIANSVVIKINKIHTYEVIKGHLSKLINYKTHLNSAENAKQSMYPSFGYIFYCQSIVNDVSLNNFCSRIKRKFPDVKEFQEEQIDSEIIRHHKKNEIPTPTMVNEYLLKLINQEGLDLAEINKAGHNIRYGA